MHIKEKKEKAKSFYSRGKNIPIPPPPPFSDLPPCEYLLLAPPLPPPRGYYGALTVIKFSFIQAM